MAVDISDLIAKADAYEAWVLAHVMGGLEPAAAAATGDMRRSPAHGDQSGATHAGYRAIVVGPGRDGAAEIAEAAAAVEALNPGHSATTSGRLAGDVGVIFTCPTDYQERLETEQAGLGPTHDAYRDALTAAAARGP